MRNARAHVILQHLILNYARPNSKHPIATNKGVNGIFFMTLPLESNQVIPRHRSHRRPERIVCRSPPFRH